MARYTISELKESASRPDCPKAVKQWVSGVVSKHRYDGEKVIITGYMANAIADLHTKTKAKKDGKPKLQNRGSGTADVSNDGSSSDAK